MEQNYVCPCLLGLEGLVAGELRAMEVPHVEAQNGRVLFRGGEDILARVNLGSRYAERVQILVGSFPARSFEELFEGVKGLPWEQWIGKKDAFPVKGRSLNSKLTSIPDCQAIIKKAVVEHLKMCYRLPWFEESGPLHQIQFLIMKDQVQIMLDTSGPGLHKRGYRAIATQAPIKETLAAAMCFLSRVRSDSVLIDPFCGSGTIAIEGALLALNIAPGLKRSFAVERWESSNPQVWSRERERAQEQIRRDASFQAYVYDIDQEALSLALKNAKKAGVSARITGKQQDIRQFACEGERGTVVCNPPYGERLLDVNRAEELYEVMGNVFIQKRGWSYTVISPDTDFERCYGRKADKRRKLYNGMIPCQIYQFFKNQSK